MLGWQHERENKGGSVFGTHNLEAVQVPAFPMLWDQRVALRHPATPLSPRSLLRPQSPPPSEITSALNQALLPENQRFATRRDPASCAYQKQWACEPIWLTGQDLGICSRYGL